MKKIGRAGSTFGTVVAAALVLAVATTGGAVAGGLITSKQIKNNTIKSIDVRNGTLTPADMAPGTIPVPYGGSYSFSKYRNFATLPASNTQLVDLTIPEAGNYVIDATLWIRNLSGSDTPFAPCTLAAGADTDYKEVQLRVNDGSGGHRANYALQVVHSFGAPGSATLTCAGGSNTDANDIKVTAIKVDHLTNTAG